MKSTRKLPKLLDLMGITPQEFSKKFEGHNYNDDILNISDFAGNNFLHYAVKYNVIAGYADIIRYLVQEKLDINAKNLEGDTPLHLAIKLSKHYYCENIIYGLIMYGADVNIQDGNKKTPIDLLYQKLIDLFKDEEKLKYLIENWNIIEIERKFELNREIQDYIAAIRILKNPEITHKLKKFCELSTQGNLTEIRKILTEEPYIITAYHKPLEQAVSNKEINIVKMMTEILLENGRKINEHEKFILVCALDKAIASAEPDIKIIEILIKTLADAKIDINNYKLIEKPLTDNNRHFLAHLENPFSSAVKNIDLLKKLVDFFRENHFNITDLINISDYHGNTPLHYAVENGEAKIISFLIDNGAKLENNTKNNDHQSDSDKISNNTKDIKDAKNIKKSFTKFEMIKDMIKKIIDNISKFVVNIFTNITKRIIYTDRNNKVKTEISTKKPSFISNYINPFKGR